MKVCAVIPAYNEQLSVGKVVEEVRKYVDTVLVIDDGSTDDTGKIAREYGAQVIRHETNKGTGYALQSGYDFAISGNFDSLVQLDGDCQHDPRGISQMLNTIKDCDVVIGSRFLNHSYRQYPFIRRVGIRFFTFVVNLLVGTKITDVTSGYRMFRTEVLKKLTPISRKHWAVEQTLEIGKAGFKIKEVSINMPLREAGNSQFSLRGYVEYPFRMALAIMRVILFR